MTNINDIIFSENDINVMGLQTDPIVFIAHGRLTGTQFYLNSDKLILYTMTQPGAIFSARRIDTRRNLISKQKKLYINHMVIKC
jgi:hypothetical protein